MSGLPLDKFEIKHVNVGNCPKTNEPIHIRTILCDVSSEKPTLLKVHGYGSGAAMFYKCIKELSEHFSVILIDLPGMAGSTRVNDYDYENITAEK